MSGTSVASEHAAPHILENVMGETSRRLDVDHTCTGILPNFSVIERRLCTQQEEYYYAGPEVVVWVSVPW